MLVVQELGLLIDLEPTGISSWLRRECERNSAPRCDGGRLMAAALLSLAPALLVVVVVVDLRRGRRTAGEDDDDDEVYRGEGLFVPPPYGERRS